GGRRGCPPPERRATEMDMCARGAVRRGGSPRGPRAGGGTAAPPPLLLVQMGPGLPMINEIPAFGRALSLEDDFTVIYWDQRGCGRSLRSADATHELSLPAMVGDTERLLALLCDRFGGAAVVARC